MSDSDLPVTLPTPLPTQIPELPGAFTSASLNAKLDEAAALFDPEANGFKAGVAVEDHAGVVQVKAVVAVKFGDGWAVYGEGAMDLHGNKSAMLGIEGGF